MIEEELENFSNDNEDELEEIHFDESSLVESFDVYIVLHENTVHDQRVYNAPSVDEVAVIWPDNASSSESLSPHILVAGKSYECHRIYHNYGCYDPLQYPLLFPYGDCGWTQGLKKISHSGANQSATYPDLVLSCSVHTAEDVLDQEASRAGRKNTQAYKFISLREYYAYKLQIRPNNMLLRAGRCLQQYIVDMYVNIKNIRLHYFRNDQSTIRANLYQGILDSRDLGKLLHIMLGVGSFCLLLSSEGLGICRKDI
ncbi:uncharacterized protein LOC110717232 [Chenopodium quinoa]|uniref:uncharacterized protein LOC110717232 n=1 Tax=Chenopodium quinoa TaxID=63459 RepID=UPI000B793F00|nr:uncharacterized protein LOC110717232 [Chenopodium quinoa]